MKYLLAIGSAAFKIKNSDSIVTPIRNKTRKYYPSYLFIGNSKARAHHAFLTCGISTYDADLSHYHYRSWLIAHRPRPRPPHPPLRRRRPPYQTTSLQATTTTPLPILSSEEGGGPSSSVAGVGDTAFFIDGVGDLFCPRF